MPRGTYLHLDPDGHTRAVERFSCAPGPEGWRYSAEIRSAEHDALTGSVDVVVDASWRQLVVTLASGAVSLRGGVAGDEAVWARTGPSEVGDEAELAAGFVGVTAGLLVAVARHLALADGERASVALVRLSDDLVAAPVEQDWTLTGVTTYPTDLRPLEVERFDVHDRTRGDRWVLHLAGDVVLDAPGLALDALESPPTAAPSPGQPHAPDEPT